MCIRIVVNLHWKFGKVQIAVFEIREQTDTHKHTLLTLIALRRDNERQNNVD